MIKRITIELLHLVTSWSRQFWTMAEANAVSLKLPSFWTTQPEVWFKQAEAQFAIRNIAVDNTKYAYILAALDQDTASLVLDLLSNPPEESKYEAIKGRLLRTYGLSRRVLRANRHLQLDDLGDRKPSVLMDEMLSLLDGHSPCLLFEQLYFNRMPDPIRLQLAEADFTQPRTVAEKADQLWLSMGFSSTPSIHRAKYRHPVKPRNPTPRKDDDDIKTGWCFYHSRFGARARKCLQPCSYQGNFQAGRQRPRLARLTTAYFFYETSCQSSLPGGHRCRSKRFPGYPVGKDEAFHKQRPNCGQWYKDSNLQTKDYRPTLWSAAVSLDVHGGWRVSGATWS